MVPIAYLVSALALLVVGIYLASESVIVLVRNEHPAIGTVVIFGQRIWLGYLMMWWADAVAAIIISLDILHDGSKNLKQAVFDLMNQVPKTVDRSTDDPLLKQIKDVLNRESWIKESKIRVREEVHIYFGEAFVVPKSEKNLFPNMSATKGKIADLSWLFCDFNIIPVESLKDTRNR